MTTRARMLLLGAATAACAQGPTEPEWMARFGYSPAALHRVEIRDYGYPFVPVVIRDDTFRLPFDTGNMAGLTLAAHEFAELALPCSEKWDLFDSAGKLVSTGCTAHAIGVNVFGTRHDSVTVREFFHETLPGLVGTDLLPGTRFTLDYGSRRLASDSLMTPEAIPGFVALPLVRSPGHPRLILVEGEVNGRPVLIEIDTGKSRTTIDRVLAEELALEASESGVRIDRLRLGPLAWTIPSARVVDTSGISQGLPGRISAGIGSDLVREFVLTVDYEAGLLWVEEPHD